MSRNLKQAIKTLKDVSYGLRHLNHADLQFHIARIITKINTVVSAIEKTERKKKP